MIEKQFIPLALMALLVPCCQLHAQDNVVGGIVADPAQIGGEAQGQVKVAHVVYARDKSSECFSDHFLIRAQQDSAISTSGRLHSVRLDSDDIFSFPLLIMTGEGDFSLSDSERAKLRSFVERGGFLLASAGCSSGDWNVSFRRELRKIFADKNLKPIPMNHLIFHTVYDIKKLNGKSRQPKPLEGLHFGDRLGVLYSQDGLNNTKNKEGCCCCGGNEITNSEMVNVNILVYSLLH